MSAKPEIVLIDGAAASSLSVLDRGLHYGDGLFETIACQGGRARFLNLHLQRLAEGCERLRIRFSGLGALREEIERLASPSESSLIKVIVTRGVASARGYAPTGDESATRVVLRYSWPQEDPSAWRLGISARTAVTRLGENPGLAGLKHLNRLEQVLARAEPGEHSAAEALMFSTSGFLVSGTMSNVFMVCAGVLRTPRIERCGVAGVMRRVVLQEALSAGIAREECDLNVDDLNRAEEMFITNARIGVWPLCSLDSRPLTPGPITRSIQELLLPLLAEPRHEPSPIQGTQDSESSAGTQLGAAGNAIAPAAAAAPTTDIPRRA